MHYLTGVKLKTFRLSKILFVFCHFVFYHCPLENNKFWEKGKSHISALAWENLSRLLFFFKYQKRFYMKNIFNFCVQQVYVSTSWPLFWVWCWQERVCSDVCAHFANGFTVAKRSYINSISVGKIENSVENTD